MTFTAALVAALLVFSIATVAMAIGAIAQGKCLKGTCGGLNQMRDSRGKPICDACAPEKVKVANQGAPDSKSGSQSVSH